MTDTEPLLAKNRSCGCDESSETPSLASRLIMEFIGTFFLVLTVYLCVAQKAAMGGLAIGTVLGVMIFAGGHVSGGHYNPAVTVAVVASMRNNRTKFASEGWSNILKMATAYISVQCLAGIVAGAIGFGLTAVQWTPAPDAKYGVGQALIAEILFTFALASIVLNVATSEAACPNHYYGYAIGLLVFVGASTVGNISGAVFNPAVGTGITLMSAFLGGSMANIWIYWMGPITGGALAAGVFRLMNPSEYAKEE